MDPKQNKVSGEKIVALFKAFAAKLSAKSKSSLLPQEINGRKSSGKTKVGARHNHQPTFHSRQIMSISPAQYRRFHFGEAKKESKSEPQPTYEHIRTTDENL